MSLEAGFDAGRAPQMLSPNQAVSGINMTVRGGDLSTRPGFRKLDETFPVLTKQQYCYINTGQYEVLSTFTADVTGNILTTSRVHFLRPGDPIKFVSTGTLPAPLQPDVTYYAQIPISIHTLMVAATLDGPPIDITDAGTGTHYIIPYYFENQNSEYIYRNGIFQCALAFSPHNGEDCIMALIGGRLFKIIPLVDSAKVEEIVIKDESGVNLRNRKDSPIAYMVQADKWLIAQDGNSKAIIYDSNTARRAVTATTRDKTEIPVGSIMSYGMGRIVVVVNKRDVAFGDLYGSHDLPDPSDSLVFFTERNFLSEGFDAAIPFQQGVATGAVFFPQLDTSTGNGQLLVFAERGAASFFLSLPRDQWKTSQFQILALLTTGMRGHRSLAVVNEDLWFRADDGLRSYRQARSEAAGWAHIPLSTNVRQYLDNDSSWLLRYASGIYFDNRILMTISPAWNQGRPFHTGMVGVDFDILSSFGVATKPAWEGKWTFPGNTRVTQLLTGQFKGVTRAFAFCLDDNDQNQLFEISKNDTNDWNDQRIEWEFVSRAMDFSKLSQESTPFNEAELYDADIWLREIRE